MKTAWDLKAAARSSVADFNIMALGMWYLKI